MAGGKTGITVQRNSSKDIIVTSTLDQPTSNYVEDTLYAWTDSSSESMRTIYTTTETINGTTVFYDSKGSTYVGRRLQTLNQDNSFTLTFGMAGDIVDPVVPSRQ